MMPSHETANKIVIATAVTSPWWIEMLHRLSDVAAFAMPLFAFVFLIAQMIVWFWRLRKP